MLGIIVSTIFIALVINLILKRFQLPTIIGYIFTGTIIAYAITPDDLGIEFSIEHLKKMKREVFLTGSLQILVTTTFVFLISYFVVGLDVKTSMVIGAALSLSSTAIVLKTFNETKEITKPYGRRVLGILIMQDIAVIPILLMISFFTMNDDKSVAFMIFEISCITWEFFTPDLKRKFIYSPHYRFSGSLRFQVIGHN